MLAQHDRQKSTLLSLKKGKSVTLGENQKRKIVGIGKIGLKFTLMYITNYVIINILFNLIKTCVVKDDQPTSFISRYKVICTK